jgi:hypothetical protein
MKKLPQLLQLLLNHRLYLFFLNFIGLTLIIWFVFARFILHRLPKNIPFDLHLIRFIILLSICLLFAWVIKKILFPREPSELSQIFLNYIYKIYKPLYVLDETLRSNNAFKRFILLTSKILPYFIPPYEKFIVLISKLSPFFKAFDVDLFLYLMIFFAPRVFLLILLIVDVFYYNCISLFYSYAYIGLIPLLAKYYIYAIRSLNEEYLEYLDGLYYVEEKQIREFEWQPDKKGMGIREFVELKSYCYSGSETFDEILDMTRCECGFQLAIFIKYNKKSGLDITEEELIAWKKDFYDLIPPVVDIARFLDSHDRNLERYADKLSKYRGKRLYIIWVSIAVYSGYLICWAYILIVSLSTFHLLNFEMVLLENFQDVMDPFTNEKVPIFDLIPV